MGLITETNEQYYAGSQKFLVTSTDACFKFANKAKLQIAVDLWVSDKTQAIATYGQINTAALRRKHVAEAET